MAYALTYCRVQACLLALPGFSMKGLPIRVRAAVGSAMTPLLAGHAVVPVPPDSLLNFAMIAAAEVVTGLILGGMVRLFALSIDIAASAIASVASLSQLIGVQNEYAPHPIGNLMHMAGIALLMALGFPALVCDLLRESLILRPVGDWPQAAEAMSLAVGLIRRGFMLAMLMAAPFILGGFLFQLLSGMVSKVMPSLPVMFIAAPGAIMLALAALLVLTPSTLGIWADAVLHVMQVDLP